MTSPKKELCCALLFVKLVAVTSAEMYFELFFYYMSMQFFKEFNAVFQLIHSDYITYRDKDSSPAEFRFLLVGYRE